MMLFIIIIVVIIIIINIITIILLLLLLMQILNSRFAVLCCGYFSACDWRLIWCQYEADVK